MTCQTTPAFTVTSLTHFIKTKLENDFRSIVVQGEMSNVRPHSGGHLYFDLKDAGAKISSVMFRRESVSLPRPPKEGDQVQISGSLAVYPPHGKYQIIVTQLEYLGIGKLLLEFEALKEKLKALGWFDKQHKKGLPSFPKRIGVITSPTGAVIRDIIYVLSRRFSGYHLILNPVRVQGELAADEIAQAIHDCNVHHLADVLIIARGGGSLEDLWCFNEESVAKAIFDSHIPIISAVGHETDFSLADFVADVRAPTPSAAAEIVVSEKRRHLEFLQKAKRSMAHALMGKIATYKARLARYERHPLFASALGQLAPARLRLDDLASNIEQAIRLKLERHQLALSARKERLAALNPKNVLGRGYAILFAKNENQVIDSVKQLTCGKRIHALLADGEQELTVNGHGL